MIEDIDLYFKKLKIRYYRKLKVKAEHLSSRLYCKVYDLEQELKRR